MSKFGSTWYGAVTNGTDPAAVLPAIDTLQQLLPAEGGFAIGEYSLADAAVTPFLARASVAFSNDFGAYDVGQGKALWETLQTDAKYARFRQYFADVTARDNFKQTFDEVLPFTPVCLS